MPTYEIRMGGVAIRQLGKLRGPVQQRIATATDALASDPRPAGAKRLTAVDELWRIRVGVYRVVYEVEDDVLRVLVVRAGHRREAYRHVP
jgi:mRNA interferase RelE/StbE